MNVSNKYVYIVSETKKCKMLDILTTFISKTLKIMQTDFDRKLCKIFHTPGNFSKKITFKSLLINTVKYLVTLF